MNDSFTFEHPPEDPAEKHFSMGRHFQIIGQNDRAIEQFRAALSIEPNAPLYHAYMALSLSLSHRDEAAKAEARIALELNSGEALYHFIYGTVLKEAGDYKNALPLLESAVAIDPYDADFFVGVADGYHKMNRNKEAEYAARQALTLEPENATAHLILGHALLELGRKDEARPHFEWAIQLKPDDMGTHHGLGVYFLKISDNDQALFHLREALRLDPESTDTKHAFIQALGAKNWFYGTFWKWSLFMSHLPDWSRIACVIGLWALARHQFYRAGLSGVCAVCHRIRRFLSGFLYLYLGGSQPVQMVPETDYSDLNLRSVIKRRFLSVKFKFHHQLLDNRPFKTECFWVYSS